MSRYNPPAGFAEIFSFIEWFLVRAFLVLVLAFELWECLKYLVQHMH